ncbi:Microtubule-associated protein TORTIFOLIA1 [Linum grandiflorum]
MSTQENLQSSNTSRSSSLPPHFAQVALKQKVLTSLSKLADHDTYQIAVKDLDFLAQSLSLNDLPVLLNTLYSSSSNFTNKPIVRRESIHLLSLCYQYHCDLRVPNIRRTITHIVQMLRDSDPSVRKACCRAFGVLSGIYLKQEVISEARIKLFVGQLFKALRDQNEDVQSGAAMCLVKLVECAATNSTLAAEFKNLLPSINKMLSSKSFQAKASLLSTVSMLAQVGAIAPQSLEPLLQNIHGCLTSTDWATRKAAADALCALAVHSCSLVSAEAADSTLSAIEACRFDKIKPVRDSINEALQLWKKIAGKEDDGVSDQQKASCPGGGTREEAELSDKNVNVMDRRVESSTRDPADRSSPAMDSASKTKPGNVLDKAVVILKKKPSVLTDKELNPEFFQNLEKGSGELPVEVVVPRGCINSSNLNNEEESTSNNIESRGRSDHSTNNKSDDLQFDKRCRISDRGIVGRDSRSRAFDRQTDSYSRETTGDHASLAKTDEQQEGSLGNSRGNWLAIQRQLLQLERQQTHLMHMLQDFMGGSHDSIMTLENRVRGLERVVEDMARDLSMSSARRDGTFAMDFEGSTSNRSIGKYNGFSDYSSTKYSGRGHFGDRFEQYEVTASAARGRNPQWRANASETWDFSAYGSSRRGAGGGPIGSPKSEHENDRGSSRRGWDKGGGPSRFGEGPSARSVWQASKDEATLEAIRVAGEDNGLVLRTARVAIPELTAEAMGDDNGEQERDPIWTSWSNAMDALKVGDMDTAYAELCWSGDEQLLVKMMLRTGPVMDQVTNETACEILHAIAQLLLDHNLFDLCFSWIHQLVDIVMENGSDVMAIPMELKRELLLNLNEAASTAMEQVEEWEGVSPDQLLLQLASAWGIQLRQQFDK